MSVLIKNMEMPRVCAECFMDPPCCKSLSGDTNIWKERYESAVKTFNELSGMNLEVVQY